MIYRYYDRKGLIGYFFEKERPFLDINARKRVVEIGELKKQDLFRYEETDNIEKDLIQSLGKNNLEELITASVEIKTKLEKKLEMQPWFKGYAETFRWNARDAQSMAMGVVCMALGAGLLCFSQSPEFYASKLTSSVTIGIGIGTIATRLKDALAYFKAKKALAGEKHVIQELVNKEGIVCKAVK